MATDNTIKLYLREIGRKGGLKSRRQLSRKESHRMLRIREARRAFKNFHSQCFWSYKPNYKIEEKDIEWVRLELMKNGGRKAYEIGVKLCP